MLITTPLFIWAARRAFVLGRAGWQSYELRVHSGSLERLHAGLPPMEIARDEITGVHEDPAAGLTVRTAHAERLIVVPRALEGYAEVRDLALAWAPAGTPAQPKGTRGAVPTLVMTGAWIATGVLPDIRLAMIAGAIVLLLGARFVREARQSALLDARQKRSATLVFGLMMVAPLARLMVHGMNALLAP